MSPEVRRGAAPAHVWISERMMGRFVDIVIIGTFAVWLVVTIASQFWPDFKRRVRWPTSLLFVLGCGLFAYIPREVGVAYRDRSAGGDIGPWIPLVSPARRRWFTIVWAASFWYDLHVVGIIVRLIRAHERLPPQRLAMNMWYRLVVALVEQQARSTESELRQFRIESSRRLRGRADHRVVFTSEFRAL